MPPNKRDLRALLFGFKTWPIFALYKRNICLNLIKRKKFFLTLYRIRLKVALVSREKSVCFIFSFVFGVFAFFGIRRAKLMRTKKEKQYFLYTNYLIRFLLSIFLFF